MACRAKLAASDNIYARIKSVRNISHRIFVLVALDKSVVSRTKKLSGIFRACAESGNVELKIMDDGRVLTPEYVDREIANGINGFIVGANGVSAAIDRIDTLKLPLVIISLPHQPLKNACTIHTDNARIGREAAQMLMTARACRSYAFYPAEGDPEWSKERADAFLKATAKHKGKPNRVLARTNIVEELLALPRPLGILAANDTYAAELLGICRSNNLRVPMDVSVIGVDNDETLCEGATPSITSIEPDFEREGYEAVKALVRLRSGEGPSLSRCGIKRVVIRKSTIDENHAEALVNRAMDYINEKATAGITVGDVCGHLKVSRRLLGLRFHEIKKFSPLDAIIERKLAVLKKELATSDAAISAVCRRCGFGSENHPKKLFRERFNMTMRDFRAQAKTGKDVARGALLGAWRNGRHAGFRGTVVQVLPCPSKCENRNSP